MKTTNSQDLIYPEPEDYAAALTIKKLAVSTDAALFARQTVLNSQLLPPTLIRSTSVDIASFAAGTLTGWLWDTVVYQVGAWNISSPAFGIPPEPGGYLFGMYANMTCSGTITTPSERRIQIQALVPTGPAFGQVRTVSYIKTVTEGGLAAGTWLTVEGAFDVQTIPSNPLQSLTYSAQHNNASNVVIKAGAFMWCTKISDPVT